MNAEDKTKILPLIDGELIDSVHCGDCRQLMSAWPSRSVDLVFGSPPYEDARTYGIDFKLAGQQWVDWLLPIVLDALRVSRGLVALVVEGRTKKFAYTATPILLMADLLRAGVTLRKPPIYYRSGIPGSGGPDWFRNDYEFVVCATNGGRLPWSDNTACGKPPKFATGGDPTYRYTDGRREKRKKYKLPTIANPGNVIHCKVGCGAMGNKLAHENEAPFSEALAERFVKSFCPPGGIVFDPFGGSGTTAAVAKASGRHYVTCDIRASQVDLINRRLAEVFTIPQAA